MELSIIDSSLFTWVLVPLFIFLARICDVTIGTIRILFLSRGDKLLAPILGFFEVLIWLLAIGQIMQNLSNILCYLAYASGFAFGNFVGIIIEEKLALGKIIVRIITQKDATELIDSLRSSGFGVTSIKARGAQGRVHVLYSIIERCDIDRIIKNIHRFNPRAFYTLEDVRYVKEGIFPERSKYWRNRWIKPPRFYRRLRIFRRQVFQRKAK
ncbi:MAG TPA: DUF2179 domain-containing protein [bacterium]|nr:DUF2179 domain-containing protein [bacterium]